MECHVVGRADVPAGEVVQDPISQRAGTIGEDNRRDGEQRHEALHGDAARAESEKGAGNHAAADLRADVVPDGTEAAMRRATLPCAVASASASAWCAKPS